MGEAKRRKNMICAIQGPRTSFDIPLTESFLVRSGTTCEVCGRQILRTSDRQYTRYCSAWCRRRRQRRV